jgi:hypothetical protein
VIGLLISLVGPRLIAALPGVWGGWAGRVLGYAALGGALLGFGWVRGIDHQQLLDAATLAQHSAAQARVVARQAKVTTQIVTKYIPTIQTIKDEGHAIDDRLPAAAAGSCDLPADVRLLIDAAATGDPVPDTAGRPDAPGTGAGPAAQPTDGPVR